MVWMGPINGANCIRDWPKSTKLRVDTRRFVHYLNMRFILRLCGAATSQKVHSSQEEGFAALN